MAVKMVAVNTVTVMTEKGQQSYKPGAEFEIDAARADELEALKAASRVRKADDEANADPVAVQARRARKAAEAEAEAPVKFEPVVGETLGNEGTAAVDAADALGSVVKG